MIEVGNGIGKDQVIVIGIEDQIEEIDLSMDKTIARGFNMFQIIEDKTLGGETLEEHKIIEDKTLERNIEENHGNSNFDGVEADQEIGNFQVNLEGITEVGLGQDQDQEQTQIETELGVSDAENMITLPKIIQILYFQKVTN